MIVANFSFENGRFASEATHFSYRILFFCRQGRRDKHCPWQDWNYLRETLKSSETTRRKFLSSAWNPPYISDTIYITLLYYSCIIIIMTTLSIFIWFFFFVLLYMVSVSYTFCVMSQLLFPILCLFLSLDSASCWRYKGRKKSLTASKKIGFLWQLTAYSV